LLLGWLNLYIVMYSEMLAEKEWHPLFGQMAAKRHKFCCVVDRVVQIRVTRQGRMIYTKATTQHTTHRERATAES
jgi:hypothetical protein